MYHCNCKECSRCDSAVAMLWRRAHAAIVPPHRVSQGGNAHCSHRAESCHGHAQAAGLVDGRPPVSGPRGSDLVTSLPLGPCYGALQEPLQQTRFYDSDTVRACVTHVFLFALSHFPGTHTHRCSVFCFCSEAVLICVCLHCLLVFYLIAALAV